MREIGEIKMTAQTKQLNDLQGNEYTFLQNDGDILDIASEFVTEFAEDITGAVVKVGDGEYLEVWLTESSRPFELSAIYHTPAYWQE